MHNRAMGLSSVLTTKDALLFTVANLVDSRVKLPLEEAINQGKISTFNSLFQGTVEFNKRYVGHQTLASTEKAKGSVPRHTTFHVQDDPFREEPLVHQAESTPERSAPTSDQLYRVENGILVPAGAPAPQNVNWYEEGGVKRSSYP